MLRVIKNIKERRKIYAAREFSGKYDLVPFKFQINFAQGGVNLHKA
jgi:hypothetical protein